jgi:hypothetical protein
MGLLIGFTRWQKNSRSIKKKMYELISNTKTKFLNAPSRIDLLKTVAPSIPLPPTPI